MKIGVPKGLLYYRYHPFIESFFTELGAEIVLSEDTNRTVLDQGVKYCVDEGCLPIKVFHGHTASLKDKCDFILVPRIMRLNSREFICPKFCGLPEMIINDIPDMPSILSVPFYADTPKNLFKSIVNTASSITRKRSTIERAFKKAVDEQNKFKQGILDSGYELNIALEGHPYNIYDTYINMNLVSKLNNLGIGVFTSESVSDNIENPASKELYKKPFWTFARESYDFASHVSKNHLADGIIYVSSFACGIDSVVIDLIKDNIGDFPLLVIKLDEHTGDAGIDTRLEAFCDMLERRC